MCTRVRTERNFFAFLIHTQKKKSSLDLWQNEGVDCIHWNFSANPFQADFQTKQSIHNPKCMLNGLHSRKFQHSVIFT